MGTGNDPTEDRSDKRQEQNPQQESQEEIRLPDRMHDQSCPTNFPGIRLESYRPIEALNILGAKLDPDSDQFASLREQLAALPPFMRIQESDLLTLTAQREHVVNITGYSGQGVHPGQRELLEHAYLAIMQQNGWTPENSFVISGGTAVGSPDLAVRTLTARGGFDAIGIMALPGTAYEMTPGYMCICVDDAWRSWSAETEAMGNAATATIVTGGGAQALTDALISVRDKEKVAIIVNAYNGLARIPYSINGMSRNLIVRADSLPELLDVATAIFDLDNFVAAKLRERGVPEAELSTVRVTDFATSGLVTELRNGQRRACSQDLLYYAVTGNQELLPKEFRHADPEAAEAFRQQVIDSLDFYYLFDSPHEGVHSEAIIRLDEIIAQQRISLLERVIDHAVQHDVESDDGIFGPAALGADTPEQLAEILKQELRDRFDKRPVAASVN